ncbi:MAG TPA: hypothetical protein VMT52_14950, partial [Planctomycetota bacterium]|nr:hypothetical protein [Planctomycetota bacterium]
SDQRALQKRHPLQLGAEAEANLSESNIAMVLDRHYNPSEVVRADPFKNHIPYDWALKQG